MFQKVWLILSEGYSIDPSTNQFSILNMLDKAWVERFPAKVSNLHAMLRLKKSDGTNFNGDIEVKVVITMAGEQLAELAHDPMKVVMEKSGAIIPLQLNDISFPKAGDYEISIYIDNDLLCKENVYLRPLSELSEA